MFVQSTHLGTQHLPSTRLSDWQTRASAAYYRQMPDPANVLPDQLVDAVKTLIGRTLDRPTIIVDPVHQAAFANLDGVHFRFAAGQLTIVRPCTHCALGTFFSPPILQIADLGYTIAEWKPFHDDCRPFEADDIH